MYVSCFCLRGTITSIYASFGLTHFSGLWFCFYQQNRTLEQIGFGCGGYFLNQNMFFPCHLRICLARVVGSVLCKVEFCVSLYISDSFYLILYISYILMVGGSILQGFLSLSLYILCVREGVQGEGGLHLFFLCSHV